MNGANRPALFFYLIEKLDEMMLKDPCGCLERVSEIDQNSIPLATTLYGEWKAMKKEEKEKYEEIRRKYGMTKTGEMTLPRLRSYARWFSLVHHRYFLIQRPSALFGGFSGVAMSDAEVSTYETKVFRDLLPKDRQPYETLSALDKQAYNEMTKKETCVRGEGVRDRGAKQKSEVWRPAVFFFLRDCYDEKQEEMKEASRAAVVSALYDQWLEMGEEEKRPYEEESASVVDVKTLHRYNFSFMCYAALWKRYEKALHPGACVECV